ncbi:MAG: hypothetical protein K8R76_05845 [Candidatus Aegiribacteria sp.]|nr:hypothetical protein [Candidatus Aegiribacteria sp.]
MNRRAVLLAAILPMFILVCCGDTPTSPAGEYEILSPVSPQPRGDRLFGITISESVNGFENSFAVAQEAGVQIVELNIPWNCIEVSEGVYQDPWGGVFGATSFYGDNGISLMLGLAVINTVTATCPDYLEGYDWNSPEMIEAFNNLVDWVVENIPSNVDLICISVGNEVDLYLDDSDWSAYISFFQAASDHITANYPDIAVGVKVTVMNGVFGGDFARVQEINQYSDVVMLNYYPQISAFVVLDPDIVKSHFAQIGTLFSGREIWFNEVGYQSGSEYCGSSQTKQAEFYHHLFTAWDTNRSTIGLILIDWLHDVSPEVLGEFEEYYGSSDPAFLEYLATLGLRNYNDTDKYAWVQLLAETGARGW